MKKRNDEILLNSDEYYVEEINAFLDLLEETPKRQRRPKDKIGREKFKEKSDSKD